MAPEIAILPQDLLSAISGIKPVRIGVDGLDGVGKSTLAKSIADRYDSRWIPVDEFIAKNQGAYVRHLDIDALLAAVGDNWVVIDGVCLLHVLDKAHLPIDYFIYVKRLHLGLWADEEYLGLDQNLEEFLQKERYFAAQFAGSGEAEPDLGLTEEIIRYHHRYRPHESADFIVERHDS